MAEWKEAWRLAVLEWKASRINVIYSILCVIFLTQFLFTSEKVVIGPDIFLLVFFTTIGVIGKSKAFRQGPVNDKLIASPALIMLKTLPANRFLIAKRQFLLFFLQTIPWQLILFILLYLKTPEINMPLGTYLSWALLWISFSFWAGSMIPAFNISPNIDTVQSIIITFGIIFISMIPLAFIVFLTGSNLLHLSMDAARKAPVITALVSIAAAVIGLQRWYSFSTRRIHSSDLY